MIDAGEKIVFLKRALGECEASRDGQNFSFSCPECKSSKEKKKLVVKIETGQWHCWVCESKGKSIPTLLRKYAKNHYSEWCTRFEKDDRRILYLDEPTIEEEKVELPDGLTIDEMIESQDPDAKAMVSYLFSRGIDEDTSYKFRMIGCIYGRLRRRIVIPSFDREGNINYWTARSIEQDSKYRYVNPKINRRSIIFNEIDIDWKREITIVEGPFDMIKAGDNSVALLGSTLPQDSLLFQRIVENKTPVIIALDSDALLKSHKIASTLYQFNIKVKFLEISGSRDIGEMSTHEFQEIKKNAVEWNPINKLMFKINTIASGSIF